MLTKHLVVAAMFATTLSVSAQTNEVKVVDYLPAPGQFVNQIPKYKEGYNQDSMNVAATKSINDGKSMVHLGTFGGYVVFQFDHPIRNIGKNGRGSELLINGNGFYAARKSDADHPAWGGSIEPGIVYVGVGDDYKTCKWYELAGSQYNKGVQITKNFYCEPEIHDFTITYHKPLKEAADSAAERKLRASILDKYIRWECSWTRNGARVDSVGYHMKNSFHKQPYWPQWIDADSLTFSGGKLPNNYHDESGKGTYFVQFRYGPDSYGYVDAAPNSIDDALSPTGDGTNPENTFDIDWAVDENGNFVHLDEINFVKVVCGIFQYCGWLGETSTEISKVEDLTLRDGYEQNPIIVSQSKGWSTEVATKIKGVRDDNSDNANKPVYNLMGQRVKSLQRGHVYISGGKKFIAQ